MTSHDRPIEEIRQLLAADRAKLHGLSLHTCDTAGRFQVPAGNIYSYCSVCKKWTD